MLVLYNESEDDLVFYHYDEDMRLIYNYVSNLDDTWQSFVSKGHDIKEVRRRWPDYEVICEC